MNEFSRPTIEWFELLPVVVVFAGACIGVAVEAFVSRRERFGVQTVLTGVVLVVAMVTTLWVALSYGGGEGDVAHADGGAYGLLAASGTVAVDGPTVYLWGLVLLLALLGVMLFAERRLDGGQTAFASQSERPSAALGTQDPAAGDAGGQAPEPATGTVLTRPHTWEQTEVYPLLLFAVTGMMLLPAANNLLLAFVALEILSLPLYLMAGMARRRRLLSQEAALKYFLLGAFASAFFLYGAALVYGYAGSMEYGVVNEAIANGLGNDTVLLLGTGLLAVGLFFKVGAAPFHAWTPDVYQGAPTPLTAFMAAATKVAAFGALVRLLYVAVGNDRESWLPAVWVVALVSMVLGTLVALTQNDVKRLLAWSAVAHAGFVLTGVLGVQSLTDVAPGELTSLEAVLFYLTAYGLTTLGAFAVVSLVRDAGGETTDLARWGGLGRTSPWVAGVFTLFLLAMAGIPLTSGFVAKFAVFEVAAAAGAWPVVVTAVLASVLALYVYVKVVVLMYFRAPVGDGPSVAVPSWLTVAVIAVAAVATVGLGVLPDPLLDLLGRTGELLR